MVSSQDCVEYKIIWYPSSLHFPRQAAKCKCLPPYNRANPYVLEDLGERELLAGFISSTCEELPLLSPKTKKE